MVERLIKSLEHVGDCKDGDGIGLVSLPIHEKEHWSLVIICHLEGSDLGNGRFTCPLHLDFLQVIHKSKEIFELVSNLLKVVWRIELSRAFMEEELELRTKHVAILRQANYSNCGVFVLYSMQKFVGMAPKVYTKLCFMEDDVMVSNPWILNEWGRFFQERGVCLSIF
jgi:Ulp1 family protease